MKREIKFRAWTKKREMQYDVVPFEWDYVLDTMWHKCIESNGNGILGSGGTEAKFEVGGYAIKEGDLMQFTGLKDTNGKDIYEGDKYQVAGNIIYDVRYISKAECDGELYAATFVLWFSATVFFPLDEYALRTGVVIGNIYETPELLKSEK